MRKDLMNWIQIYQYRSGEILKALETLVEQSEINKPSKEVNQRMLSLACQLEDMSRTIGRGVENYIKERKQK